MLLLSQRALLHHPQYAPNVKHFSHNGLNKMKVVVISMGGFLLSKKKKIMVQIAQDTTKKNMERKWVCYVCIYHKCSLFILLCNSTQTQASLLLSTDRVSSESG